MKDDTIDDTILEYADSLTRASLRRGAESAEVYFSVSFARKFIYQEHDLDAVHVSENRGFSLRVIAEGRQGFAYLSSGGTDGESHAVEEALSSARMGDEPAVRFQVPAEPFQAVDGLNDPDFFTRDEKIKKDFIKQEIEDAYQVSSKIKKIKKVTYAERFFKSGILTSGGFTGLKSGTTFSIGATALAGEGDDNEVAHEWSGARVFEGLRATKAASVAAKRASALLGGRAIKTGCYPVILHPAVACDFLSVFAAALSGEMIAKNKSPLAGKLEKQVGSQRFSIVDDGLLPGGYSSEPFDDEGFARKKAVVVEKGILKNYLLNLKSAAQLGRETTGNAYRADYKSMPSVSPANFHILPGPEPIDTIMEGVSRGVYVVDIMGAHTMDPVSGNVSLGASGFMIEKGETSFPVRGITIAGNLYDMFLGLQAAGNDIRFFGEVGSPSLLVENVDVAGHD